MLAPAIQTMDSPQARPKPGWSVLLPREHGSWALVLEPLVVALLAAPSWRGAALALAALALFLMRRPFMLGAAEPCGARRTLAVRALVALGMVAAASAALGVGAGPRALFAPLAAAAAAAGIFFWFDRQREARAAIAECAGAATYAALAAAIALVGAADGARPVAIAVGVFALARAWTSILPVRVYVRRRKGRSASGAVALAVAGGFAAAAVLTASALGTWVPAGWLLVFLARTAWMVGPWAPSWPARRIGWMEAGLGLVACLTTGLSLS